MNGVELKQLCLQQLQLLSDSTILNIINGGKTTLIFSFLFLLLPSFPPFDFLILNRGSERKKEGDDGRQQRTKEPPPRKSKIERMERAE